MSGSADDGLMFVEPIFQERVWGGTALRDWFGEIVPPGPVGECWAISALPGQAGRIRNGRWAGSTVDEVWRSGGITGREQSDDFPILVKFLDAVDRLSVQVHPDDSLAAKLEGHPRGKAECWYVVDRSPDARLVLGHRGDDVEVLRQAILSGTLEDLLVSQEVAIGDFFMVPAGVIHALGPGVVVYEVQQSSDVTYRLYDYGRIGLDGKPRDLHIEKGLAAVATPFDESSIRTAGDLQEIAGGRWRQLVSGPHFSVSEYRCAGSMAVPGADGFRLGSVVSGSGTLTSGGGAHEVSMCDSFISPAGAGEIECEGEMTVILTEPGT